MSNESDERYYEEMKQRRGWYQIAVPTVTCGEYNAGTSTRFTDKQAYLSSCIEFGHHRVLYVLHGLRELREFAHMLKVKLNAEDSNWRGDHFFAYLTPDRHDGPFNFRRHTDETTLAFLADEWNRLDQLMDQLLSTPEMRDAISHYEGIMDN
jgi:hypothetical protein